MAAIIDQHGLEGKALQQTVKIKLRSYLGEDYDDEVLPLYIVVMLAHQTQQDVIAENLEAFLAENAVPFTSWLFQHLGTLSKSKSLRIEGNTGSVQTQAISAELEPVAETAAPAAAKDINASRDRREQDDISLSGSDNMSESSGMRSSQETGLVKETHPDGEAAQAQGHERHRSSRQRKEHLPRSDAHMSSRRQRGDGDRSRQHQASLDHRAADFDGSRHRRSDRHTERYEGRHQDWEPSNPKSHDRHGRGRHHQMSHHSGWYPSGRDDHASWHGYPRPHDPHSMHSGGASWQPSHMSWDRHGWDDPWYNGVHEAAHRHRSLSPPRYGHSSGGGDRGGALNRSLEEPRHHRYQPGEPSDRRGGGASWRGGRRRDSGTPGGVPPEIDFEAKAKDVPLQFRHRQPVQQAHVQPAQPMYVDQRLSAFTPAGTPGMPAGAPNSHSNGVRYHTDVPVPSHAVRLSDRLSQPDPDSAAHLDAQSRLKTQLEPRSLSSRPMDRQQKRAAISGITRSGVFRFRNDDGASSGSDDSGGGGNSGGLIANSGGLIEVSPLDPITPSSRLVGHHVAERQVAAPRPDSSPASTALVPSPAVAPTAAAAAAADDHRGGAMTTAPSSAAATPATNTYAAGGGGGAAAGGAGYRSGGYHSKGAMMMEGIREQLHHMATVLNQLRAAARLEAATSEASRASVFSRISFPGQQTPLPEISARVSSHLRSVTVTAVHPLALEHPAILRAHFGTTGHILRTTVLRDQETGMASGKAHVEYDNILSARKALQLSRSLLLDRLVYVRMKKR